MDPRATSTNKAKCRADENSNAEPKQSPVSENAAMERHANTKRDEEDLPCTKDLTRGTEDIHNRNVRHTQDPCTSPEASAEGTSAECAEMTPVILESALLHEMQTEPQDSLLLTPRLPTDGEPSRCKQEVAESIVMAGCTNWTVKMAEPTDADADVDRTALLSRKLAERASGVDEGDEMERGCQTRLQQIEFYCNETRQRNGNATENIPSAHGLPLEGEWSVYPSDKSDMLVILSVESEDLGSNDTPRVYLGGMQMRLGHANGLRIRTDRSGSQMEVSKGLADGTGAQTDAPSTSNKPEMTGISKGEGAGTYLCARDAKHVIEVTDGIGSHTDVPSRHGDIPSIETYAIIPANVPENVRSSRKKAKPPDLPMETTRGYPDEPNGCRNHVDGSSVHVDVYSVGNERKRPANETESVSTRQTDSKT